MVLSVKLIITIHENYGTKNPGHISKNRVERLVTDGILDSIDLTKFDVCVECIKGKQTKTKKFGAYRVK